MFALLFTFSHYSLSNAMPKLNIIRVTDGRNELAVHKIYFLALRRFLGIYLLSKILLLIPFYCRR